MIKADLKQYTSYKANETNWSGEIPESWDVKRIKDFATVVRGGSPRPAGDPNLYEGSIPFLKVGDLTSDENVYLSTHTHTIKEAGLTSTRMVPQNTLLLTNSGATLGIPKICRFETTFNDGIAAFTYLKNTNKVFLFYFLKSQTDRYLNQASLGQGQPNLNIEIIANTFIPCPSLEEQQAIADYLEAKTRQIDRKIDLLEQKAEKYTDLKQSLINETVTRGLDKTVPMKDSGVEWIGLIPAHWEMKRVKEVANINRKVLPEITAGDYEFDYVDISSVTYGMKDYKTEKVTFDSAPSRARRIVQKGDIIISTVRTYLKAITWFEKDIANLIVSTGFAVITPKKQIINKYCSYWLTSNTFVDEVCALSTGVSYPATNASAIGNLFCLIPPHSEQKAIADYLEAKTAHIEKIIETINLEVEKLKELRKTLINDVVTGKIKVFEG